MDISADKYELDGDRHQPGLLIIAVPQIIRWLVRLFKVTDEDLSGAGIYLGGEGHD